MSPFTQAVYLSEVIVIIIIIVSLLKLVTNHACYNIYFFLKLQ